MVGLRGVRSLVPPVWIGWPCQAASYDEIVREFFHQTFHDLTFCHTTAKNLDGQDPIGAILLRTPSLAPRGASQLSGQLFRELS